MDLAIEERVALWETMRLVLSTYCIALETVQQETGVRIKSLREGCRYGGAPLFAKHMSAVLDYVEQVGPSRQEIWLRFYNSEKIFELVDEYRKQNKQI